MSRRLLPIVLLATTLLFACKTKQNSVPQDRLNVDPQTTDQNRPYPIMTFDRTMHDFGTIKKGDKKETTFYFTNTGNADLEIEIVTSCNCTTLDYSTDPVPPQGKGKIHVLFDSSEKEESEIIDVTIILKNINPENGYPIVEEVKYKYTLMP